jgi:hypothetical protein
MRRGAGNRRQSRRPRPGNLGPPELAGNARRCNDIAIAPDTGTAALAMRDQYRLGQARRDRRGAMPSGLGPAAAASGGGVDAHLGLQVV